jgi:HPt (histidine-containing phosphotransfer) domain-containing protein
MALATEEEWESDPELKAMRADFVASFKERRLALEALAPALASGGPGQAAFDGAFRGVGAIAHKLAGAAETYGFPTLTRASAALEDWVDGHAGSADPQEAVAFAALLASMLDKTQSAAKDVPSLASDPAFVRLEASLIRR